MKLNSSVRKKGFPKPRPAQDFEKTISQNGTLDEGRKSLMKFAIKPN